MHRNRIWMIVIVASLVLVCGSANADDALADVYADYTINGATTMDHDTTLLGMVDAEVEYSYGPGQEPFIGARSIAVGDTDFTGSVETGWVMHSGETAETSAITTLMHKKTFASPGADCWFAFDVPTVELWMKDWVYGPDFEAEFEAQVFATTGHSWLAAGNFYGGRANGAMYTNTGEAYSSAITYGWDENTGEVTASEFGILLEFDPVAWNLGTIVGDVEVTAILSVYAAGVGYEAGSGARIGYPDQYTQEQFWGEYRCEEIPEPATMTLGALALGGLLAGARKRR